MNEVLLIGVLAKLYCDRIAVSKGCQDVRTLSDQKAFQHLIPHMQAATKDAVGSINTNTKRSIAFYRASKKN